MIAQATTLIQPFPRLCGLMMASVATVALSACQPQWPKAEGEAALETAPISEDQTLGQYSPQGAADDQAPASLAELARSTIPTSRPAPAVQPHPIATSLAATASNWPEGGVPHVTFEDRERYPEADRNPVNVTEDNPVSTFSIDVDTAAYANIRRYLQDGILPPTDAVRIEEMVNYFDYGYEIPAEGEAPFAADLALFQSPWSDGRTILRVGLQGYDIAPEERPPANLVFLVDTSGSMNSPDKLPLLRRSLSLLVDQLGPEDTVSIVAYAGSAGVVLEPTPASDHRRILATLEGFQASGSTAGADGIHQAYALAEANFDPNGLNRVILATDGDFNVGISDPDRLEDHIAAQRDSGVYLSVLGFGTGNLNDALMQRMAQAGNGNAAYIDTLAEAQKVLVDELTATLFTIAEDVKIQIEFNPTHVAEWRLIGYETRLLAREDFNNDRVDAGEVGSGHAVTALYELTPPDGARLVNDLRYSPSTVLDADGSADGLAAELAHLQVRYKEPGAEESKLLSWTVAANSLTTFEAAPQSARFATMVAAFGQRLRQDPNVGLTGEQIADLAREAMGTDRFGYRAAFVQMVRQSDVADTLLPMNR